MQVSVSGELFSKFAQWVLAGGLGEEAPSCETWTDAPDSRPWKGLKALKGGPDRYNSIDQSQLNRFLEATGTRTERADGFSDRTGDYGMVALEGHFARKRARWAEHMARSGNPSNSVVVIEDGSTHAQLPEGYTGRYWVGRWDGRVAVSEEKVA